MIHSLTEAILNADKGPKNNLSDDTGLKKVLYTPWKNRYSETIDAFYNDFIAERLPQKDVVIHWHNMLVDYIGRADAILPVRAGNTKKLRRGWLVEVDSDFSYMFTDNDLAAYIYKMVLDGYCPDPDEFFKFMTEFVAVDHIEWWQEKKKNNRAKKMATIKNIIDPDTGKERYFLRMPVHFNQIGGSGEDRYEPMRNAYINTAPAPVCCLGSYNYKHAHIVDVAGMAYKLTDGSTHNWETIKDSLLGAVDDYTWDDTKHNYVWARSLPAEEKAVLRELLKAHSLRFLDPMNHFLAPMLQQSKFTDVKNNLPALDIAEYKSLQKYLIGTRKMLFNAPGKAVYDTFLDLARVEPTEAAVDANETTALGNEKVQVVYHEKSLAKALYGTAVTPPKPKKPASSGASGKTVSGRTDSARSSDLSYQMAAHYLRNTQGLAAVGTKFLPTPDSNGSKTFSRLKRLGILGEHKGLLIDTDIDAAIGKATGTFKETLLKIKEMGL